MRSGFIGLGQMGSRMAANLLRKSDSIVIYDKSPHMIRNFLEKNKLLKQKINVGTSPYDVANKCTFIVNMVPENSDAREVYMGNLGIDKSETFRKNGIVMETSTLDPTLWKTLAKDFTTNNNIKIFDAPVSGGIIGAEDASLCFMLGSENETDIINLKPELFKMGKTVFSCGKLGSGQIAKLTNNMIFINTVLCVSEAMNLGIQNGLDPNVLNNIFNSSTAKSWVTERYSPVPFVHQNSPASNEYKNGYKMSLVVKDLSFAAKLAQVNNIELPFTKITYNFYKNMFSKTNKDKDFTYIYNHMKKNEDPMLKICLLLFSIGTVSSLVLWFTLDVTYQNYEKKRIFNK